MSQERPGYRVPDQLRETLLDFTIAYLLERPTSIEDFGLDFFRQLKNGRTGGGAGTPGEVPKTITKKRKCGKKKSITPKRAELPAHLLTDGVANNVKTVSDPLQGFKVIKWKLNPESEAVHHLFIKKHHTVPVAENAEMTRKKPPGRTILCHNVPPFLSEAHLKDIFRPFGNIYKIFVPQKHTVAVPNRYDHMFPSEKGTIKGFKVAYIVYTDTKHVDDIMELNPDNMEPVVLKSRPFNSSVDRWAHNYNKNIYSTSELEASVRKFMENFDKEEVKRKEMGKNGGQPDEDGRGTKKRASCGRVRSEAMEERRRAKKRKQELPTIQNYAGSSEGIENEPINGPEEEIRRRQTTSGSSKTTTETKAVLGTRSDNIFT